jgi:hypothetical protein
MFRRRKGRAARPRAPTFWPFISSVPLVGFSMAGISLSRVDLPAPEWPITVTSSPAPISASMSASAVMSGG